MVGPVFNCNQWNSRATKSRTAILSVSRLP